MAKWIVRIGLFSSIYLAVFKYDDWGWGAILSSIGLFAIASFTSFLLSGGKKS
ncbi:hypothetical protein UY416_03225 [Paenibacillus polymyxa]|uniref:hypothetical protein n=1 Tax=Paenibacillus TaxID=44249 RepID=UPI000FAAA2B7|nr:hypothetical protein [Paenibacillus polymyxa]MDY8045302.1 hypothetical protein [Paenibacillus polymyxa]WDM23484.1 hypothetical protein J4I02_08230 [Paenibacillus polymyxa]